MKEFTIEEIKDLLNQVMLGEISFPEMVEVINEIVSESEVSEFKDGDFVDGLGCIFILHKQIDEYSAQYHVLYENNNGMLWYDKTYSQLGGIDKLRLATEAEKQELLDALVKEGKRWNVEKLCVEDIELKSATVDLKKGVVVAEYGQKDIEKDISEIAVDFGSAVDYLFEDLHLPAFCTTKKHRPKVDALNQLIILAEAWNSFDEFEPDWEDHRQEKHYPSFAFKNGKFEFSHVSFQRRVINTHVVNFGFKTEERAEQFGKQFIDLFRIALTN